MGHAFPSAMNSSSSVTGASATSVTPSALQPARATSAGDRAARASAGRRAAARRRPGARPRGSASPATKSTIRNRAMTSVVAPSNEQPAVLDHAEVIGEALHVGQAVRRDEDGALFVLHGGEQLGEHRLLRDRVEPDRRLVEDQHLRPPREREEQRELDARAERQRRDPIVGAEVERRHQPLAVRLIPGRVEAADELDRPCATRPHGWKCRSGLT